MLTQVHGGLLTVSDLARGLGVSFHTVQGYLDTLEATFMVRRLPPYYANISKRLVRSPKVYLRDSGLLHRLAGLWTPGELSSWPRRGSSFEGLVIEELAGLAADRLGRIEVCFWRTHAGAEVDLLIVAGRRMYPIEIKLAANVEARQLTGLRSCMADLTLRRGWVVYSGDRRVDAGGGVELVPWAAVRSGNPGIF